LHAHHAVEDDENVSAALDKAFISGSNPVHKKDGLAPQADAREHPNTRRARKRETNGSST